MSKLLLFGYGNPGRGDDALGPLLIEKINQWGLTDVTCLTDMQLLIEHTCDFIGFQQILFVDADVSCDEPFLVTDIYPEKDDSYTSHALTPAALLFIFQQIYQRKAPPGILLRIRGYDFELGDTLSKQANSNLSAALNYLRQRHLL
ncbi:MAG: hydrogenase maturation protease [Nitrosomonas sp.]|nr:MAG: hydrogenase maturation protease [Nitrosomonas sp.]